jgi:hypothetical protein
VTLLQVIVLKNNLALFDITSAETVQPLITTGVYPVEAYVEQVEMSQVADKVLQTLVTAGTLLVNAAALTTNAKPYALVADILCAPNHISLLNVSNV